MPETENTAPNVMVLPVQSFGPDVVVVDPDGFVVGVAGFVVGVAGLTVVVVVGIAGLAVVAVVVGPAVVVVVGGMEVGVVVGATEKVELVVERVGLNEEVGPLEHAANVSAPSVSATPTTNRRTG